MSLEWNQGTLQNVTIKFSLHYALEDADLGGSMPTDPSPDVEFDRMLWFWFSLGSLANLPITSAAELLKGN